MASGEPEWLSGDRFEFGARLGGRHKLGVGGRVRGRFERPMRQQRGWTRRGVDNVVLTLFDCGDRGTVLAASSVLLPWRRRATCSEKETNINNFKKLKAGHAEMTFQTWYTADTNHFRITDFCQSEIKKTTGLSSKPSTS